MERLIEVIGFNTTEGLIWNSIGYLAFFAIIIGAAWERGRNALVTAGAVILTAYAALFLKDVLLTASQLLIVVSGTLQLLKTRKKLALIIMLQATGIACLVLLFTGSMTDIWAVTGFLGLIGIAFGLIVLPTRPGFLIMAISGLLLTIYAWTAAAWIFFLLNLIFAIVNIYTWLKTRSD